MGSLRGWHDKLLNRGDRSSGDGVRTMAVRVQRDPDLVGAGGQPRQVIPRSVNSRGLRVFFLDGNDARRRVVFFFFDPAELFSDRRRESTVGSDGDLVCLRSQRFQVRVLAGAPDKARSISDLGRAIFRPPPGSRRRAPLMPLRPGCAAQTDSAVPKPQVAGSSPARDTTT